MKKQILTFVGILIIIIFAFFLGNSLLDNAKLIFVEPTPTQISIQVVIAEIRGVAELVTAQSIEPFTHQYNQDNGDCFRFPEGPTEILYSGKGEVRAGIDLRQISSSDITVIGSMVTIKLPPPKIITSSARYEILDIDMPFSLCDVSVSPESQNKIQSYVNQAVLQAACEADILEIANVEAERVISELMRNLSFSQIIIQPQKNVSCP